jgi:UDP-glucose:(heptosyl)LPS alpha-1,3-glucosyltransferase
MKIAFILQKYNKKGGIEKCTAELCQRLAGKHDVHVFTTSYDDYDGDKIKFHIIDNLKLPKPFFMIEHWLFLRKATSVANKLDFDIVHGGFNPDVITAHSCNRAWIEFKKQNREFLRYLLNPAQHIRLYMEKQLYNNQKLKKVIAVSEGTKKEVLNYYKLPKEMVTVIPNGVDAKIFSRNDEDRIVLRKEYNLEEDDIILLFVGNEFLRKGLDVAIKALALLDNKRIKLCVVGGADKARYINLAKKLKVMDRLIFAGKSVEVEKYYSMADIFVFPTKYEAFSLATLEALAAGLPLIISKVNGAKEVIQEGNTGYLVNRIPREIADKVSLILNSNKLERMRFDCLKLAEKFTWDINANRYEEVYKKLMSPIYYEN